MCIRDRVYGAVMTATDSVAVLAILDPQRQEKAHAVVFGEGVLNDAITIVLFKTFVDKQSDSWGSEAVFGVTLSFVWLLLASTAVGIFTGAICCISIRKCSLGEADPHLELLMTALFAWLSYILAEVFGLSAIMSAFVCGIMLSHYNHYNMAKEAAGAFSIVSHALSEGAEAITFFYIGVTLLAGGTIKDPYFDFSFIFFTIFCLTLARGISVGTVLSLSSVTFLPRPFGSRQGLVTWFAGLVRGVVAFALALTLQAKQEDVGMTSDQSRLAVTSTAVVVIFTTIVFGSCSFLFLQWVGDDEAPPDGSDQPQSAERNSHHNNPIYILWKSFDEHFIMQYLGGRPHSRSSFATTDISVPMLSSDEMPKPDYQPSSSFLGPDPNTGQESPRSARSYLAYMQAVAGADVAGADSEAPTSARDAPQETKDTSSRYVALL
eukprot:TRINITY_DN10266_c0_g1_i1.p1 TRINITY_DN10266_c0_g1~~TRINITY_DN10266_c0_g1_i1.p1  ORF type:complete len:435 (+),score=71.86 TRINITY_DN10266_c0_g1_i1:142-1446(+)